MCPVASSWPLLTINKIPVRTSRSSVGFLAGRKIHILTSCVLGAFLRLNQPCLLDAATSACAGRSCARRACIGHCEQRRIDAGRRHAAVRKQNLDADVHLRSGQQVHQDGLLQGAPDERRELSALPAAPLQRESPYLGLVGVASLTPLLMAPA